MLEVLGGVRVAVGAGRSEAWQVAPCGPWRDRARARTTTEGLQGLAPRGHAPSCARRLAGGCRWSCAGCAWTARTDSGQTMCCAGVAPTTSARQRRWAGPLGARPVSRSTCRRRQAVRQQWAAGRAPSATGRARGRARRASAAPVGTSPGVRAPARARRASGPASRRSVVMRAPARLGRRDGATTRPASSVGVRAREGQEPPGPAAETKMAGCRLGEPRAEERMEGPLARANGPQGGPRGALYGGDRRHGQRLLVHGYAEAEGARLRQGGPPSVWGGGCNSRWCRGNGSAPACHRGATDRSRKSLGLGCLKNRV
jgi:hypothetical protein